MRGRRSWGALLAQFFFPQRYCLICGTLSGEAGACAACAARLNALGRCEICAAFTESPGLCSHCAETLPLFTQARAAAPYGGKLRDSLLSFKYQENTWLRRPLAALLAAAYEQHYSGRAFSAVIPIPLASARLKERGYNQSALLAQTLAAELGINYQPGLLKRVLDTPPLANFNGEQRRFLLKQAFAAGAAEGQRVLLIDDIYTSGATLNTCTEVLLQAGAQAVYGLTVTAYDDRGSD